MMRSTSFTTILAILALPLALAGCGAGDADDEAASPPAEGLSAEAVASAAEDFVRAEPGQYESTMEVLEFTVPGLPDAQAQQLRALMANEAGTTRSFCLTQEEADQGPERMIQEMAEAECVFERFDISGSDISARMQCADLNGGEGTTELEGEMTPTRSVMTMQIDQSAPGMPGGGRVQAEMRVTSNRVGDCP